MSDVSYQELEFSYESMACGSYLLITADGSEKLINYQVEMIKNNRIKYILPLDVVRRDEKLCFYCNITSRLPLLRFLKMRKITRDEFIGILQNICRALLDCRNYLLNEKCFLLKEDFIYINPATLEISMAYIPLDSGSDAALKCRELAANLILFLADFEESGGDNFIQKVLSLVKSDMFNIQEFSCLLDELSCGTPAQEENALLENEPSHALPAYETGLERHSRKPRLDKRTVGIAVIVQVVIVASIVLSREYLKSLNGSIASTYAAVAVIVAAFDLLLFKLLFKSSDLVVARNDGEFREEHLSREKYLPLKKDTGALEFDYHVSNIAQELKEQINQKNRAAREAAGFINDVENDKDKRYETVFLADGAESHPCLLREDCGQAERIYISKPDFLIGRLEGCVDYVCRNKAVGKVHARIITRDGSFFLVDINSKNGTFINDERIESNKEYRIRNNDRICFANLSYTFIEPLPRA